MANGADQYGPLSNASTLSSYIEISEVEPLSCEPVATVRQRGTSRRKSCAKNRRKMESYCKPSKSLTFDGDLSENWRKFRRNFEIFLKASRTEREEGEVKVALLLNFMGEEGVELYDTFNLDDAERHDLEKVLQAFQEYCCSKKNVVLASCKFFDRTQAYCETWDCFPRDLEKLCETCEYGSMKDRLIRDRFVSGIRDKDLQKSLLKIHDLDLQKAVDFCRAAEAAKAQTKTLGENNEQGSKQKKDNGTKRKHVEQQPKQNFDCSRCATSHCPKQCPAFGKKCKKCGTHNHFAIACKAEDPKAEEEETNEARSKATFRYTVENFSKMKDEQLSPPCYIRNLPWKIKVMPRRVETQGQKYLGFYLECNAESGSASWTCYAEAELRLLSNKEGIEPLSTKIDHLFYSKASDWGFKDFVAWHKVLDVENGYIKDDSITLEVHVKADMPHELK